MSIDNPNSNHFKEDLLLEHLKKFSFPRLAGTDGEPKAVDLVLETFTQIGHKKTQIRTQPFKFSDFYSTTCIKLIGVLSMTFLLILVFFSYIFLYFKVLILGSMALVVVLIINGLKHPEIPGFWGNYYGNILSATNVYVKIPATQIKEKSAGNIVVSAHLDTKSQTLRTIWRVRVYLVWLYSGIILGVFYITKTIYLEILTIFNLTYEHI